MRRISAVLAILIGICYSCEKKEDPQYSGEIILSSELLQSDPSWSYYGFTFEDGQIKLYPAVGSVRPDLSVTYNDFNQIISLEGSDLDGAFYMNGSFTDAGAAEAYFNSYGEVIATDLQPLASEVEVNQIWTVRTAGKKFAKIWIKDKQLKTGTHSDFVELTIKYQYQPDGTKTFPQ